MPFFSPPLHSFFNLYRLFGTRTKTLHSCVCVCLVKMDGQQTAFGRHAAEKDSTFHSIPPFLTRAYRYVGLFVTYILFPFGCCAKNSEDVRRENSKKKINKINGRRTQLFFRGVAVNVCAGFSHTRVKFTQLLVTPPTAGEKKNATTPFSSPTRPLCLFHFFTTHTNKNLPLKRSTSQTKLEITFLFTASLCTKEMIHHQFQCGAI